MSLDFGKKLRTIQPLFEKHGSYKKKECTSGKCHSITNLPVALTNLQVESPKTMWALRLVIGPCGAAAMGLDGVRG